MSKATASITLTPAMMASAFWDMGSDEQSEFFDELAQIIKNANNPELQKQQPA